MKKRIFALAAAALLSAVSAFGSPLDAFKGQSGTIDIAGGTAHIPVMKKAAEDIMTFNPDIRISVAGGGSGVGVKQVGEGVVQIGNTGRALKAEEVEKYGLVTFPFAIDGVALAVNPANPVKALTSEQAKGIYTGAITDWKELGGEPGAIDIYGREDGSGTRQTFDDLVLGKNVESAPSVNAVNSNGAMKTAIANDPRAIGYVGIGYLDSSVAAVALDGAVPNQENAASGAYRVTRQLYMNTKGEPEGIVKAFIDYIYSDEGAKIISDSGYIPLKRK
ncbi:MULTISPECIES: phosphate ABC transporter substrate-binding protein [Jonquetella]|uniref:Phosphate-binding protein n=1 Tax=Jonquetella anthropi DSM 22815 TaxID=885272 RepID=H0UK35_9BACT|nr:MULTISPECIES: phosphate ABC transporter substrate-binding protein [Jonquetella]EEX48607.1 phosphate binding protein [Jonquetella anthropi E3_33 E1]EHM13045.1 phosphate binding protein [Jonquetella anthropi DSM 22815]ERL23809.1 phosphate binding protein [Jonquetella sp. BV3C21]